MSTTSSASSASSALSALATLRGLGALLHRMLLALVMVASVSTGVMLSTSSTANAEPGTTPPPPPCSTGLCTGNPGTPDDDDGEPIEGEVGTPGQPDIPDDGPGGNEGGSGGISVPGVFGYSGITWQPANPPTPIGGGSHLGLLWSAETKIYRYRSKCEGNYSWTDQTGRARSRPWLGTRWAISGTHKPAYTDPDSGEEIPDAYTTTSGGYECIEPPQFTVYLWTCVIAGRAAYHRLPLAENNSIALKPRQRTPFALGGKKDPDLCADPADFSWIVPALKDDGSPRWPWGRYELSSTVATQKCNYTDWDTINQRKNAFNTNTINCFGPLDWGDKAIDQLELFCNPPYLHKVVNGGWHSDHTYTAEDCKDPGSPEPSGTGGSWSCGPLPRPTFNGRMSPNGEFEVLDDAKDRMLKWSIPAIRGDVQKVRKKTVKLGLDSDVSPYRSGESTNGSRQPYKVVPDVDEWKHNWRQAMPATVDDETGWRMAFMAPGVPGKPWSVRPTWAFEADFLTKRVSGVSIDPATGEWTVTLTDYWYTADASCTGAPADLNVYRARNSQGR